MSIQKAQVASKSDVAISPLPIENKVVANDINELRRASDETIDYIEDQLYCGLFVCGGDGPSQTITSNGKVTIDQWDQIQPQKGFSLSPGDISIPITEPGIYEIRMNISYETTARNGEIFLIRTINNGDVVAGICTRVQHQHPATTTYEASAGRLVEYTTAKTLAVEFAAQTLSEARTIIIRHGSFTVRRIDTL